MNSDYNPYGLDRNRFESYEDFDMRLAEEKKAYEDELYTQRAREQAQLFDLLRED